MGTIQYRIDFYGKTLLRQKLGSCRVLVEPSSFKKSYHLIQDTRHCFEALIPRMVITLLILNVKISENN